MIRQEMVMDSKQLTITCPLCGRRYERLIEELVEGMDLICPHCNVKLNLHGHMWADIQNEIAKLNEEP
jgi:DNA-directed RNA polymerase subunit RPC12/RpoP